MSHERIDELRADLVTVGLSTAEQMELEALMAGEPAADDLTLDLAAAAIEMACLGEIEPLPDSMRATLARQAENFAAVSRRRHAKVTPITARRPEPVSTAPARATTLPWLLAAAAMLAAVVGWFRPVETVPPTVTPTVAEVPPPAPAPTPSPTDQREILLTASSATLQLPWTATEDPASQGASGDLVWNNEEQRGFMRFEGLEANDPSVTRYQLWIFDGTRDDRYPIDGGLFDVPPSGEVVVPIDARLNVSTPVLFAVTVEEPEGVVVSTRERIVLVAQSST